MYRFLLAFLVGVLAVLIVYDLAKHGTETTQASQGAGATDETVNTDIHPLANDYTEK